MDELAAAAAVVAMAFDSENPEDAELETTVGTVGAAIGEEAAVGSASADEENQQDLPVPRRLGTANPKVILHPLASRAPPIRSPKLTLCPHPCHRLPWRHTARRADSKCPEGKGAPQTRVVDPKLWGCG